MAQRRFELVNGRQIESVKFFEKRIATRYKFQPARPKRWPWSKGSEDMFISQEWQGWSITVRHAQASEEFIYDDSTKQLYYAPEVRIILSSGRNIYMYFKTDEDALERIQLLESKMLNGLILKVDY